MNIAEPSLSYLSRIDNHKESLPEEYQQYANSPKGDLYASREGYRPGALEEFEGILHDYSLKSDDVPGISKVSPPTSHVQLGILFETCPTLLLLFSLLNRLILGSPSVLGNIVAFRMTSQPLKLQLWSMNSSMHWKICVPGEVFRKEFL